jgi:uncharacterized coiled-coil DUF342 family protein
MSDYPNIDMMLKGCTSGSTNEWPVLRNEARRLLDELASLRAELAAMTKRMNHFAILAAERYDKILELEREVLNEKCAHNWTQARSEMKGGRG